MSQFDSAQINMIWIRQRSRFVLCCQNQSTRYLALTCHCKWGKASSDDYRSGLANGLEAIAKLRQRRQGSRTQEA